MQKHIRGRYNNTRNIIIGGVSIKIFKINSKTFIFNTIFCGIIIGSISCFITTLLINEKMVIKSGITDVKAATVDNISKTPIPTQITAITEDLGPIQIVGVKYFATNVTLLQTGSSLSYDFDGISGATNYIVVPYTYQWYVPYNGTVSGTTYKFNVLSIDGTAHNGRIIFYVIGYRNI